MEVNKLTKILCTDQKHTGKTFNMTDCTIDLKFVQAVFHSL